MTNLVAVLMAGATIAGGGDPLDHRVRIDHASGATEATYRGDVAIEHRQVGAAGSGGRASTLRCRWTAGLVVDRAARHASGASFARTIDTGRGIEGSRPGWCATQRHAIRQEVARRSGEMRGHLVAVAAEDHAVLSDEIERSHADRRTG